MSTLVVERKVPKRKFLVMGNIYKKLLELMTLNYFKSYRLLVTEDVIDIKLTPKNNRDSEINYSMRNTKHNIGFLEYSLENDVKNHKIK